MTNFITFKENQKSVLRNLSEQKRLLSEQFNKVSEREKEIIIVILEAQNIDVNNPEIKVEITDAGLQITGIPDPVEDAIKEITKAE